MIVKQGNPRSGRASLRRKILGVLLAALMLAVASATATHYL
jgi:hypothetical protein